MTLFYNKQKACLNCGFEFGVTNNYCPDCGQKNSKPKIGIGTLIMDLLADVFTFDSKIFRSIWIMLSKPGLLTKEFNEGKRARFIPPLRMFLVLGVVALSLLIAGSDPFGEISEGASSAFDEGGKQSFMNFGDSFSFKFKSAQDSTNLTGDGKSTKVETNFSSSWLDESTVDEFNALLANKNLSAENIVDSLNLDTFSEKVVVTQAARLIRGGPGQIAAWISDNFVLVVFFMVPVFALILKLLNLRNEHLFIDHLIFSLHQHSLVYLAIIPLALLGWEWLIPTLFFLVLPVYTFLAMRRVYGESVGVTAVKQLTSGVVYSIGALFALLLFIILGLLLF